MCTFIKVPLGTLIQGNFGLRGIHLSTDNKRMLENIVYQKETFKRTRDPALLTAIIKSFSFRRLLLLRSVINVVSLFKQIYY